MRASKLRRERRETYVSYEVSNILRAGTRVWTKYSALVFLSSLCIAKYSVSGLHILTCMHKETLFPEAKKIPAIISRAYILTEVQPR